MSSREDRQNNRFPLGLMASIAIALLGIGAVVGWWSSRQLAPKSATFAPTSREPIASPSPQISPTVIPKTKTLTVYWLKVTPEKTTLSPAPVTVQKDTSKDSNLELALIALLEIPNNPDYSTALPPGTKLLGLKTDKEGIHLNFSQEFAQGEGPNGLMGRLGQVVYTATSQDPQAKVWINVEGKPLELLGQGDGLMVEQPITRKSFQENYQL